MNVRTHGLGWLALLAIVATGVWSVPASGVDPPTGIAFREPFITRDGAVTDSLVIEPDSLVFRPLFLERLADEVVVTDEFLDPPRGIVFRDLQFHREAGTMTPVPPATPSRRVLEAGHVIPNPFNPGTQVRFRLHREADVLDARGRLVRVLHRGTLLPDLHVLDWDGCDDRGVGVASGSYLFRVEAEGETLRLKGALVK